MRRSNPNPKPLPPPTSSEAAFEALLASFDVSAPAGDVGLANGPQTGDGSVALPVGEVEQPPTARDVVAKLFDNAQRYLDRDRFAHIGDAVAFPTKVMGVSFEGRQARVAGLAAGDDLELRREPDNPVDPSAVAVYYGRLKIGFLRKEIAARIAGRIDAGQRYSARVLDVTGGGPERHTGVNVYVQRDVRKPPLRAPDAADGPAAANVRAAFIGAGDLRPSQRDVLDRVDSGRNTLAVLGTGRGKSLCFVLPAVARALERQQKTLVFYPLRALANDQFAALTRRLAPWGLRIFRANGAIDDIERSALHEALADGTWDVILSTPEFVKHHQAAFQRPINRPALVVVDEAHHLLESRHRPAYGALGATIEALGAPQTLALTATAGDEAFAAVRQALRIDAWVIDPTVRTNLHVVDARGSKDKLGYLRRILAGDGKAIVYCNARKEATAVAVQLRAAFGDVVAFYHAGVAAEQRGQVEELFRSGAIRVVVATSAFGEGIDLPDVREVVLYHLNFSFTEFNQQAGRAGRDGLDARIHLLFGDADRRINDFILAKTAPSLDLLRELYRALHARASDGVLPIDDLEELSRTLDIDKVDGLAMQTALRIFEEGGLVAFAADADRRSVRFLPIDGRVDLTQTESFAEGQAERENFDRFCELALSADSESLETIMNRPIYPERIALLH